MSSFTKALFEPTGKTLNGRAVYKCVGGFFYEIGYVGSGIKIEIEDGFETDGPSIPFFALPFFDVGSMVKASAIHDKLRTDLRFTKLEGDAIFLAAMETEGTPPIQRELCFLFVRLNKTRY